MYDILYFDQNHHIKLNFLILIRPTKSSWRSYRYQNSHVL